MKTQQLTMLLAALLILASCKKQSAEPQMLATQDAALMATNLQQPPIPLPDSINPADFVTGINNPYFPQKPGTVFHYINTYIDSGKLIHEYIDVITTYDTKVILGVTCEVVHDVVKIKGKLSEDTYDWYAQDKKGNVWYFGEDTKKYDSNGGYSTAGSFEAGVNGAGAGIAMYGDILAHIGIKYYQEYSVGVAEDAGKILNVNSTAKVAYNTFNNCVQTAETTRLTPGEVEHKFYARNLGQVLTVTNQGEREELISISHF